MQLQNTDSLAHFKENTEEIVDRLKQRVSVQFSDLDTTSALTPEDFAFQPPPDADLFFYDE